MGRFGGSLLVLTMLAAACATPDVSGETAELVGDFHLRVATDPTGSLDPAKVNTEPATWILKQICDPLVGMSPATGELVPAIAESWTISDNARQVVFKLRSDVTFHNGRELVAGDYVYSLSRLVRTETESPYYHLLRKVAGYQQVRSGDVPILAGLTAPDPQTLVVELSEPFAAFPAVLANPSAGAAVPAEEIDNPDQDFDAMPVCTGPYRVDVPTGSGEQIRLVRFDGYARSNPALAEGGRGFAASMSWRIAESQGEAYELLHDGLVDVAPVPHSRVQEANEVAGRVSSGESGHLTYIGLPVDGAVFDSRDVRRALALGMNRSVIVQDLLGGTRSVAEGFLPRSAGPAAALTACASTFPPEPQIPAAQSALEGVSNAPQQLTIYMNTGGGHETWLREVADQWEEALELDAELESLDWDPYLEMLRGSGPRGPFRLSWEVDYPSPESLLEPLFSSDSMDNLTGYSNAEFDDLLDEAGETVDRADRSAIYSQAAGLLCNDVPAIPMWFGHDHVAFGDQVASTGEVRIDVFGDPLLRELKSRG